MAQVHVCTDSRPLGFARQATQKEAQEKMEGASRVPPGWAVTGQKTKTASNSDETQGGEA